MMTPQERAQHTLDKHVIRDDWRRTGAQVRDLIAEAVTEDRRWLRDHAWAQVLDLNDGEHGNRWNIEYAAGCVQSFLHTFGVAAGQNYEDERDRLVDLLMVRGWTHARQGLTPNGDYAWHPDGEPCLRATSSGDCPVNHRYGRTFATAK